MPNEKFTTIQDFLSCLPNVEKNRLIVDHLGYPKCFIPKGHYPASHFSFIEEFYKDEIHDKTRERKLRGKMNLFESKIFKTFHISEFIEQYNLIRNNLPIYILAEDNSIVVEKDVLVYLFQIEILNDCARDYASNPVMKSQFSSSQPKEVYDDIHPFGRKPVKNDGGYKADKMERGVLANVLGLTSRILHAAKNKRGL